MSESYSLVILILKIFAAGYTLLPISVILYGIYSIVSGYSRVFGDDESSYGISKPLSVLNSVLSKSVDPGLYHRVIPHDSKPVSGSSATVMGVLYIIVGLMLLFPLVWVYVTFGKIW